MNGWFFLWIFGLTFDCWCHSSPSYPCGDTTGTTNHGQRHFCTACGTCLTIVYDSQADCVWPAAGTLEDSEVLGRADNWCLETDDLPSGSPSLITVSSKWPIMLDHLARLEMVIGLFFYVFLVNHDPEQIMISSKVSRISSVSLSFPL